MKDRLKELRKKLGLKQREVAERLGINVGQVGAWECGKERIPPARIYQLCKEFHVRREWLETGEGEMFEPGETEDERFVRMFSDFYDALDERYQKIFRQVAREKFGISIPEPETRTQINNGTVGGDMIQN